jgi:hypothetical protein
MRAPPNRDRSEGAPTPPPPSGPLDKLERYTATTSRRGTADPSRPFGLGGPLANRFAAPCDRCGLTVEAGAGQLVSTRPPWLVTHRPPRPWRQGEDKARWRASGCRAAERRARKVAA